MPPKGASRAAPKAAKAAPKPRKASKSAAAASAAPAAPTDLADHVPLDLPVTPPPQLQVWGGQLRFETPGEDFPPVSASSSDSDIGVAVTKDVFAPPVIISPIKRRQRQAAPTINRLSDLEVWGMSDEEIIGRYIFYQLY